jgi:transposase-like protein
MRMPIGRLDRRGFTAVAACLTDDLDTLLVHCAIRRRRRRKWRSTNLLERGELRRRTKVTRRFPSETNCLSLCWAVLDRATTGPVVRRDGEGGVWLQHIGDMCVRT